MSTYGDNLSYEASRVKRGAAFMDKILPGWHKEVDLSQLKMSSGVMCLLGQTFGVHNEHSLAQEMYPEEFDQTVADSVQTFKDKGIYVGETNEHIKAGGWSLAIGVFAAPGTGMIKRIINKLGLGEDSNTTLDVRNLETICGGHDNRCHWATEVADRLAKDDANG